MSPPFIPPLGGMKGGEGVQEWLSPIVAVIPGQLFAHHLTLAKGYDPDHPQGLHKVTLTR